MQEKAINNIEDFNRKEAFIVLNRPTRNTFIFGKNIPETNVEEFVADLKSVSSPSFGIVTKKLNVTSGWPTVIITVIGEKDSLELWQKNTKVLYEFYKNF
jgi:hypothetical protein